MTLLDAPVFDEARDRRNGCFFIGSVGLLLVLFVGWWLVAGRPVDWPWNWNNYLFGRATVNSFLTAVEKNDLPTAYGIWMHDKNWQQHPAQSGAYPFERFQQDWSPTSPDNEYGVIQSHKICWPRALWQWPAGGGADQRPQEQGAQPGLRPQDAHTQLLAAGRGTLPGTVTAIGLRDKIRLESAWAPFSSPQGE